MPSLDYALNPEFLSDIYAPSIYFLSTIAIVVFTALVVWGVWEWAKNEIMNIKRRRGEK